MTQVLFAMAAAFALVAAVFFLRFWRLGRDRLFLLFSAAFIVLSVHWTLLATTAPREHTPAHYAIRLVAFLLLLAAIIDKNRR